MRRESWLAGGLFFVVSLILLPVFGQGLPCSDDTFPHFYRAVGLNELWQAGSPFLQWGPDFLRGYGYPIFAFYAPLSYWLILLLHGGGLDFVPAFQLLFWLLAPLAGWGLYLFARHYFQPMAAFVAGLAYLFAPYFLYDLIQRGALPEALALAGMPWVLALAQTVQKRANWRAIGLAGLVLALWLLTHNVIPAMGLGLLLGLAVITAQEGSGWKLFSMGKRLYPILGTVLLGLGLTLFFWLPGIGELQYTQSQRAEPAIRDWPRFEQHLLPIADLWALPADPADPLLLNWQVNRTLGIGQTAAALLGLCLLGRYPKDNRRWQLIFVALVTLIATFFATQWSGYLWNFPILNFIQLPTRFLGVASLGLSLLTGLAVEVLPVGWQKWSGGVLAVGVSLSGWAWLYPVYCPLPAQPTRQQLAESTQWSRWLAEAQGEVLPRWVDELPAENGLIEQYANPTQPINRLQMPANVQWQHLASRPAYDLYQFSLPTAITATYQTFYFPGWQAQLDGQIVPLGISQPHGLIQIYLPAGDHQLQISFERTPLRQWTLAVSAGFLLICLVLLCLPAAPLSQPSVATLWHGFWLLGIACGLVGLKFLLVDHISNPIRAERWQNGQLQGVDVPLNINFSDEFTHLGYRAPTEVKAGEVLEVTQYWMPRRPIGVPYWMGLRLADSAGNLWNLPASRPFGYVWYPGRLGWLEGHYARDSYEMQLLPGIPPGNYWLEATVFRQDVNLALTPQNSPTAADPAYARIGQVEVVADQVSINPDWAGLDQYQPTKAEQMPALTLLGWQTEHLGDFLHVELLWQTGADWQPFSANPLTHTLYLSNDSQTATYFFVPGESVKFPNQQWDANSLVRDQINWRIPPMLPSGNYQLFWQNGHQPVVLMETEIFAPQRAFVPPEMETIVQAEMEIAQLVGYTLSSKRVQPGESVTLELVWQPIQEPESHYRVFVHLLGEDGTLLAQSDGLPANWTRPTTSWVVGEYIIDSHTLQIPAGINAGTATLIVGLYDPSRNIRLGELALTPLEIGD